MRQEAPAARRQEFICDVPVTERDGSSRFLGWWSLVVAVGPDGRVCWLAEADG